MSESPSVTPVHGEGEPSVLVLGERPLTIEDLVAAARDPRIKVACHEEGWARVRRARREIDRAVEEYVEAWRQAGDPSRGEAPRVYGVTTGFGEFKDHAIPPDQLRLLQKNILLSHSVGAGSNSDPDDLSNYFPAETVRAALVLRLTTFLRGHSGVREETVDYVLAMLNRGIVPLVPLRGSVGSSGDLCPLAHLFAALLGEGRYYVVRTPDDLRAPLPPLKRARESIAQDLGKPLFEPSYKEGLALTNGAAFCAAPLALATHDAERLTLCADVIASLSLEAVCGKARALDPKVHAARGMRGQIESAANLRDLLKHSKQIDRADDVQDVYSLRCAPVVHGAARDAIAHAKMVVETEINAATDNPLFFPDESPWDEAFFDNHGQSGRDRLAYSAGNFHGEPLGLAADFLTMAVAELANVSERRTQMLLDRAHNRGLPGNLATLRGVHSGYMIAQYCAAGLVSENKVWSHPASVDSIPTSSNIEDHVAMANVAASKARQVVANAQAVLGIEWMVAAQAVEWRVAMKMLPNRPKGSSDGARLDDPALWEAARREAEDFAERTHESRRAEIAAQLGLGSRTAYLTLRGEIPPLLEDRPLDEDIRRARRMIEDGRLTEAVDQALPGKLRPIRAPRHA